MSSKGPFHTVLYANIYKHFSPNLRVYRPRACHLCEQISGEEYKQWSCSLVTLLPPFSKQISFYVLRSLSILYQSQFHCLLFHSWPYEQKLLSGAVQTKTVLQFPVSTVTLANTFCSTVYMKKKANICNVHVYWTKKTGYRTQVDGTYIYIVTCSNSRHGEIVTQSIFIVNI
jgi:hypothetical protein